MAQLLELKRLKDLKVVGVSSTNGNIKLDGVETTVYTHPSGTNPHGTTKSDVGLGNCDNTSDLSKPISTLTQTALNLKVDKIAGKSLISDTEIVRLSGITSSATKVENSTKNGHININGVDTVVYTKLNQVLTFSDAVTKVVNGTTYNGVLVIDSGNMEKVIIDWNGSELHIMLTDEVRALDQGFTYTIVSNGGIGQAEGVFVDENMQPIAGLEGDKFPVATAVYRITRNYGYLVEFSVSDFTNLINKPPIRGESGMLFTDYGSPDVLTGYNGYITMSTGYAPKGSTCLGSGLLIDYTDQLIVGKYNSTELSTVSDNVLFKIGNGVAVYPNPIRSNAFLVRYSGIVEVFNDIKVKAGTVLKTISQTIQGAINELYDNRTQTVFAGTLNNSLLTIKDVYINKNTCVTDHITKPANTYFTFTAPYSGVYELDGRCTSAITGNTTIDATIGTAKLVKIFDRSMATGETIRFNNTLMVLPVGYEITLVPMSGLDTIIDNVHFVIKYLGVSG